MQILSMKIFLYNCIKKFLFVYAKYNFFFFYVSVIFKHMLGWRLCYSLSPEMFISFFAGSKSNSVYACI